MQRLVVTGNSAGGYAALVFGTLLGADTVLGFSPQTVLDLDLLRGWGDDRWERRITKLMDEGRIPSRWLDLREALPAAEPLPGASRSGTTCELYFDAELELDRLHAEHIADVPGVHLHPRKGGEHKLARELRQSGELEEVLQRALLGSVPPDGSTMPDAT